MNDMEPRALCVSRGVIARPSGSRGRLVWMRGLARGVGLGAAMVMLIDVATAAARTSEPAQVVADRESAVPMNQQDVPSEVLSPVVDEETESVIEGALRYLAQQQRPDGSFARDSHRAAITAYVIHAYLAAGHLPDEGPYGETLRRGLDFLLSCARSDGYIAAPTGEQNMYGHGIATIVLGELYGQVRDERLRPVLERAIALIVASQHESGGWRYQPRPVDHDVSVTVLQLVALRVARNGGLTVPQDAIDRGVAYVRACWRERERGFSYQRGGGTAGFARTAAAIYSLQVCGIYDDPMIDLAGQFLFDRFGRDNEWFTYGSFYAAPVQYMRGGEHWAKWYAMAKLEAMRRVKREGDLAWWTQREGDRGSVSPVYSTAVFVSVLSLPYGYLPIYQR